MDNENNIFQEAETEYRELNNELVVPAYRRFCEELHLPFHFWDELPKDAFDSEISLKEFELHNEAMDIFNRLKPDLASFKNSVVRFQFSSSDGDFKYTKWSIQDFLEEIADDLFYLKNLEHRFETITLVLTGLSTLMVFCLTVFLTSKFTPWEFLKDAPLWLGLIFGGGCYYWLSKWIKKMPRKILDDDRLVGIPERIQKLRENLANARGLRPNPLRQKRLGHLIMQELQESMTPSEIEKLVRRLKTRLFVISNDKDQP